MNFRWRDRDLVGLHDHRARWCSGCCFACWRAPGEVAVLQSSEFLAFAVRASLAASGTLMGEQRRKRGQCSPVRPCPESVRPRLAPTVPVPPERARPCLPLDSPHFIHRLAPRSRASAQSYLTRRNGDALPTPPRNTWRNLGGATPATSPGGEAPGKVPRTGDAGGVWRRAPPASSRGRDLFARAAAPSPVSSAPAAHHSARKLLWADPGAVDRAGGSPSPRVGAHLGDEREDDDTAAMAARILAPSVSPGPQPLGRKPGLRSRSTLLAARDAGAGPLRGGRGGAAGRSARRLRPQGCLAPGTSFATSSTATASWSCWPRRWREDGA